MNTVSRQNSATQRQKTIERLRGITTPRRGTPGLRTRSVPPGADSPGNGKEGDAGVEMREKRVHRVIREEDAEMEATGSHTGSALCISA